MTSHDSSALELVGGGVSSSRSVQVRAANGSAGGVPGGGEAVRPVLRHNTPSDGDEVSKAVDQTIVNSVSTADSEVFPQGGQGTHAQLLRRPSVEIIPR